METRRRTERNKIRNQIRQIQKYIQTDKATIDRFRHLNTNLDYNTAQIAKLAAKNTEREAELEILEQRSKDVDQGLLDEEITNEYVQSSKEVKRKNDDFKKKKIEERKEKKEKSDRSMAYYQSARQADRKVRWNKRDADRAYKHFLRACDSVPDYMLKKLANMPNNKGYIWRSVYCYGDLPANKGQPTILFEKKNGVFVIHEWTDREYKIWHKEGKGRKTLHSSRPRQNKSANLNSLDNYVK
jgi:hypothetical protein